VLATTVVEVQHLEKHYGSFVAVEDVTFSVDEGEIFGILGPNGAGKTTSVESVAFARHPTPLRPPISAHMGALAGRTWCQVVAGALRV
jgi:ATPase subunit of ABC transporter with duplicated ATPase domains